MKQLDPEILKYLHKCIERPLESLSQTLWSNTYAALSRCESPIEQRLL